MEAIDLVNSVVDDNKSEANKIFDTLIKTKINDAIDDKRISLAASVFNNNKVSSSKK
jgi:hypothetical protein